MSHITDMLTTAMAWCTITYSFMMHTCYACSLKHTAFIAFIFLSTYPPDNTQQSSV